jgi:hypothetical protein
MKKCRITLNAVGDRYRSPFWFINYKGISFRWTRSNFRIWYNFANTKSIPLQIEQRSVSGVSINKHDTNYIISYIFVPVWIYNSFLCIISIVVRYVVTAVSDKTCCIHFEGGDVSSMLSEKSGKHLRLCTASWPILQHECKNKLFIIALGAGIRVIDTSGESFTSCTLLKTHVFHI